MTTIRIHSLQNNASDETIDECVAVFRAVGKSYEDCQSLQRYLACGVVLVAKVGGRVVGVALSTDWLPVDTKRWQEFVPALSSDPPAYSIDQAAVLHEFRRRGIATSLVEAVTKDIWMPYNAEPYQRWMAISRVPQSGPSSHSILKRLGFNELARDPGHYIGVEKYYCPDCEPDIHCGCVAVLMEKCR